MGKIGILLLHASHVGIWVNNRFAGMQVHNVKKLLWGCFLCSCLSDYPLLWLQIALGWVIRT